MTKKILFGNNVGYQINNFTVKRKLLIFFLITLMFAKLKVIQLNRLMI